MESASEIPAEMVAGQSNRVRALFSRALHAPLRNLDALWNLYIEWETDEKKKEGLKKRLATGQAAWETRRVREDSVGAALLEPGQDQNAALFNDLSEYLTWEEQQLSGKKEKGKRDPSSGVSLFERALAVFGAVPELWLRYLAFLRKWGREDLPQRWAERAPRRCWWSGPVLTAAARLLAASERSDAALLLLQTALEGGFLGGNDDLHTVYCALEDLGGGEPDDHLAALAAHCSERPDLRADALEWLAGRALQSGDVAAFHQRWQEALRSYGNSSWGTWARYLLACPGGTSPEENARCRTLWRQAVQTVTDWPEAAADAWRRWERLWGTPESQLEAQLVAERRIRLVAAQRAATAAASSAPEVSVSEASSSNIVAAQPSVEEADKKKRTLFVKNIAFEADEAKLAEVFSPFGELSEVRLVKGKFFYCLLPSFLSHL